MVAAVMLKPVHPSNHQTALPRPYDNSTNSKQTNKFSRFPIFLFLFNDGSASKCAALHIGDDEGKKRCDQSGDLQNMMANINVCILDLRLINIFLTWA